MDNYEILGVPYNADQRAIKRAYAALIKEFRPDSHPTEFARIRSAYEQALEQCRYREQYDFDDFDDDSTSLAGDESTTSIANDSAESEDFEQLYSHLIDIPIILQPNESEHGGDLYSRLVDKPVIPPSEQNLEIPVIQPADLNGDELAWIEKPAIDIGALLAQLGSFRQPANEQAALACFQAQLSAIASMNLEQRMDYEEKLYNNLIYKDRPSLLVFAAAREYFGWANNTCWIHSLPDKWNERIFEGLSQISVLYRKICTHYNPYFQVQHDSSVKPHRLTTRYGEHQAQELCKEWHNICHISTFPDLDTYFTDKPALRPLYVMDVLIGALLGFGILQYFSLSEWLIPAALLAGGLIFSWLLLAWRTLNLNNSIGKIIWLAIGASIVFMVVLPEQYSETATVVYGALICAVVARYIYSWLTELEIAIAKVIDRIAQSSYVRKIFISSPTLNSEKSSAMNKQIYPLLLAQFLSAFADNAILFTVIAMVMQSAAEAPKWYIPALQSVFLVAYVVLGPWVGGIADRHPKARVLLVANIIKAVGAGLLFLHIEPLYAYCMVGVGAAIYSPAKYGILPELVGHDALVKANSWIEGSTILAIILGMKIGADVADHSIQLALIGTVVLFIVSALATLTLPVKISKKDREETALIQFGKQMALFFTTPRSRFAVLGASIFWAAAASLRVILVAWAPLILMAKNASQIADLTLYLTFGIIAGSIAVPRIIPLEHLRRARIPAYIMGVLITCLSLTTDTMSAQAVLFGIGIVGGMFIVPINACLQEQGELTIGSGSAVALQNFFQNLFMLLAVGAYTLAASQQVDPVIAMFILGIVVFLMAFLVSLKLPANHTE